MCKEENPENNRIVSDIIFDYTKKYNFPIIEVKELGHAVENMLFPIGGQINIEAISDKILISC